jgi:hypothetical protein
MTETRPYHINSSTFQAVVEDVLEVEGVAQIFYDRIEARCRGDGSNAGVLKVHNEQHSQVG